MSHTPKSALTRPEQDETYDEWFARRVNRAVAEADDPKTEWVPHHVAMREWEEQHKEILAMVKKQK